MDLDYDFRWGKARKSANKEKKFYSSFFMNEEEYSLYDNVIVYDDEEPDGHVAKIMKLWEEVSTGKRMALLRWYLRPVELPLHLQGEQYDPKELFMAFGLGKGVLNENSVDCIERKCKVLCVSKDVRNKQPSEADIQDADYIFLRIYNVDRKKLSNLQGIVKKLGENVLFNKEEWISNGSKESVKQYAGAIPVDVQDNDEKDGLQKVDQTEVIMLDVEDNPDSPIKRPIPVSDEDKDREKRFKGSSCSKQAEGQFSKTSICLGKATSPPPVTRSASAKRNEQKRQNENKNISLEGKDLSTSSDNVQCKDSQANGYNVKSQEQINHVTLDKIWDIEGDNIVLPEVPENVIEESMHQGKVLLLQNIDPSFTSADLYDLVNSVFKGCSGGRILNRGYSTSTIYGEALLLFDSQELADLALRDLEDSCLVLSDSKRPLIARKVKSVQSQFVARFPGHFPLDNFKLWKPEEEVLSNTSNNFHLSEIEFEMAMEWKKLQDMLCRQWDRLCEIQMEEVSALLPKSGKPKLVIP